MIVVHIGMGKCGSSTLQNFLSRNEDILRSNSVDYPKLGRKPKHNAHHNVANEIQDNRRELFDPASGTLSDLVRHQTMHQASATVLSSEMFKNAKDNEVARLGAAFGWASPPKKFMIVMVVRNLADFVRSAYFKMVKFGDRTYDFDEYFSRVSHKEITDYFEIGRRWASVFGWSNMEVRVLDSRYLLNGDLLDDFMALVAPEVRIGARGGPERTSSRNISPGWKTVEAIRALYSGAAMLDDDHPLLSTLRKHGSQKMIGETARKVGDLRGWNTDKGVYMTKQQADLCFRKYSSAIIAFNRHLSGKLPLPENPEPTGVRDRPGAPAADMIPASELKDFYNDLWLSVSQKVERRGKQ